MPIIRAELFPGRTAEMKAAIAYRMTDLLQEIADIPPR